MVLNTAAETNVLKKLISWETIDAKGKAIVEMLSSFQYLFIYLLTKLNTRMAQYLHLNKIKYKNRNVWIIVPLITLWSVC